MVKLAAGLLALVFCLSAGAGSTSAATQTFSTSTVSQYAGYFFTGYREDPWEQPLFDPSLGVLQSVTFTYSLSWTFDAEWIAGEITNGNAQTGYFHISHMGAYVGPTGYNFGYEEPPGGTHVTQALFVIEQGSGSGSYHSGLQVNETSETFHEAELLASLTAPSPSPRATVFSFLGYEGYGGECLSGSAEGCADVTVTGWFKEDLSVTYHYLPLAAVPEPSTWALMILGFGSLGTIFRGRSHRHGGSNSVLRSASSRQGPNEKRVGIRSRADDGGAGSGGGSHRYLRWLR